MEKRSVRKYAVFTNDLMAARILSFLSYTDVIVKSNGLIRITTPIDNRREATERANKIKTAAKRFNPQPKITVLCSEVDEISDLKGHLFEEEEPT